MNSPSTQALFEKNPDAGPPLLGRRLHLLRKARKLTLADLAKVAGVSKSMLSQIERNEANPTVAVLWRLTNALNVALADFLTVEEQEEASPAVTIVTSHGTPVIKSPDGKCVLRILGPVEMVGKLEWYELRFEPGGILASQAHQAGSKEHLSVFDGNLTVRAAGSETVVRHGETARYPSDVPHAISNLGEEFASALLVVEY